MEWKKQAKVIGWLAAAACIAGVASCRSALTAENAPAGLPVLVGWSGKAVVGADARGSAAPLLDNLRSMVDLSAYRTKITVSPGGNALLYGSRQDPDQRYLIADWKDPSPVPLDRDSFASFVTDDYLVLRPRDESSSPMMLVSVGDPSLRVELPCTTGMASMIEGGLIAVAPRCWKDEDEQPVIFGTIRDGRFIVDHEAVLPVRFLRGLYLVQDGRFVVVDGDAGVFVCDTGGEVLDYVDGARALTFHLPSERFWMGGSVMEVTSAGEFHRVRALDTGMGVLSPDGRWGIYTREAGSVFDWDTGADYFLRASDEPHPRCFLPDGLWFWLTP